MMHLFKTSIPSKDLDMLQGVLQAWCREKGIQPKDAEDQARILISEYKSGNHSQIALVDALMRKH